MKKNLGENRAEMKEEIKGATKRTVINTVTPTSAQITSNNTEMQVIR
jgi:hypothetical protein